MQCAHCGSESVSTTADPGAGIVRLCNDCGREVAAPSDDHAHVRLMPPRQPEPQPVARKRRPRAEQSDAPANPVPAMRARLRWLDGEIKRLRKLEAEREALSNILSAASGKPVAVVRELPKRSHG